MEAQARIKKLIRYHVLGLLLFILAGLVIILSSSVVRKNPIEVEPGATPLAQGRQVYSVRSGPSEGPMITQIVVDPFDPKRGERQMMGIKVNDAKGVTAVTVTVRTDHSSIVHALERKSGSEQDGTWEGSWETQDTHEVMYGALVNAIGGKGESNVNLSFR